MYRFFTDPASDALKDGFLAETAFGPGCLEHRRPPVHRQRADPYPRRPQGSPMRFPPSPQFLMNAAAMGAEPVEVAYESCTSPSSRAPWTGRRTARQHQGGQSRRGPEYVSMSRPSAELEPGRDERRQVAGAECRAAGGAVGRGSRRPWPRSPSAWSRPRRRFSTSFRAGGTMQIVEDVDREAFRTKAEPYLREHIYTPSRSRSWTPQVYGQVAGIVAGARKCGTGPPPQHASATLRDQDDVGPPCLTRAR